MEVISRACSRRVECGAEREPSLAGAADVIGPAAGSRRVEGCHRT